MNSCFDIAKYILKKKGPMATMKMHKLLYYCQAWSLVWDEEKLFKESIEADILEKSILTMFNKNKLEDIYFLEVAELIQKLAISIIEKDNGE